LRRSRFGRVQESISVDGYRCPNRRCSVWNGTPSIEPKIRHD
jgi:hypothetical protein